MFLYMNFLEFLMTNKILVLVVGMFIVLSVGIFFYFPKETISYEILEPIKQSPIWIK